MPVCPRTGASWASTHFPNAFPNIYGDSDYVYPASKAGEADGPEADEETAALKDLSEEICGALDNIAKRQSNWVNEDGGVSFVALVQNLC